MSIMSIACDVGMGIDECRLNNSQRPSITSDHILEACKCPLIPRRGIASVATPATGLERRKAAFKQRCKSQTIGPGTMLGHRGNKHDDLANCDLLHAIVGTFAEGA